MQKFFALEFYEASGHLFTIWDRDGKRLRIPIEPGSDVSGELEFVRIAARDLWTPEILESARVAKAKREADAIAEATAKEEALQLREIERVANEKAAQEEAEARFLSMADRLGFIRKDKIE